MEMSLTEKRIGDLKGREVALLGFGKENQALYEYLMGQGARITICDKSSELEPLLKERYPYITARLGESYLERLTDFEILFRSPGLPYLTPEIQAARQAGVTIASQTQLFLERCRAKLIGVTGTKGKSTTSAIIHSALKTAERNAQLSGRAYLAGNIGTPPISILPELTEQDWVVLELSSFQLQDLTISPHIAVVLNVTVDHLDHHRDEAEYINAKKSIVRHQRPGDYLVINLDSLTSSLFSAETPAETYYYSRERSVDQGCYVEERLGDDRLILRLPNQGEHELCSVKDLALVGAYNLENLTAAATASALAGISAEAIRQGLLGFTGLAHRLAFVAERAGVRYYDDSKSTTPDSTIAAILSFDQPVTLILGGSSKEADFSELVAQLASSTVTDVVLMGPEGERIGELLADYGGSQRQTVIDSTETMAEIVAQAAALTEPGGVVLLSPAAASFDRFKNAEDRGDQFIAAVKALPDL